ncbi:serine acetyltransferase [uncultured Collinsella sp.]|uniref:serine O-acetyltransferase n=1 Tax=uncultured Collinsella sp. TaxID=165190 RepID=UPI0025DEF5BB|nr:serine acetyltransferase [uncultured Collinsella sp.]
MWHFLRKKMQAHYGLEIPGKATIGEGFYIGHAYGITVNPDAVIGRNCNIHKGVTIGQENRGKRKGAPVLGDCVWLGVNSTVVGAVTIGDDVLIAPNSYVNCDVPSHSIVIGNPCRIIPRDNATEGYVNKRV